MCGRFSVIEKPVSAFVDDEFGIQFNTNDNLDLRPTQLVATLVKSQHNFKQKNANWGIKPAWSKKILINAQAETAALKKTFARAMETSRCLIPCSGWYEWSSIKGAKQKYLFENPQYETLLMAGILFDNKTDQSSQLVTLTNAPTAECLPYHGRMPLLIEKDEVDFWFNSKAEELFPVFQQELKVSRTENYRITASD